MSEIIEGKILSSRSNNLMLVPSSSLDPVVPFVKIKASFPQRGLTETQKSLFRTNYSRLTSRT